MSYPRGHVTARKGQLVHITRHASVLHRFPEFVGTTATIAEVPRHPNTWFSVTAGPRSRIVKLQPRALIFLAFQKGDKVRVVSDKTVLKSTTHHGRVAKVAELATVDTPSYLLAFEDGEQERFDVTQFFVDPIDMAANDASNGTTVGKSGGGGAGSGQGPKRATMITIGTRVRIKRDNSVLNRSPDFAGEEGVVFAIPSHPNTWFRVRFQHMKDSHGNPRSATFRIPSMIPLGQGEVPPLKVSPPAKSTATTDRPRDLPATEYSKGMQIRILGTPNVRQRFPELEGQTGVVSSLAVHPNTWYWITLDKKRDPQRVRLQFPSFVVANIDEHSSKLQTRKPTSRRRRTSTPPSSEERKDQAPTASNSDSGDGADEDGTSVVPLTSLSTLLWIRREVVIRTGKGSGEWAEVRSVGNGWVNVATRDGSIVAKRAADLGTKLRPGEIGSEYVVEDVAEAAAGEESLEGEAASAVITDSIVDNSRRSSARSANSSLRDLKGQYVKFTAGAYDGRYGIVRGGADGQYHIQISVAETISATRPQFHKVPSTSQRARALAVELGERTVARKRAASGADLVDSDGEGADDQDGDGGASDGTDAGATSSGKYGGDATADGSTGTSAKNTSMSAFELSLAKAKRRKKSQGGSWIGQRVRIPDGRVGEIVGSGHGFYQVLLDNGEKVLRRVDALEPEDGSGGAGARKVLGTAAVTRSATQKDKPAGAAESDSMPKPAKRARTKEGSGKPGRTQGPRRSRHRAGPDGADAGQMTDDVMLDGRLAEGSRGRTLPPQREAAILEYMDRVREWVNHYSKREGVVDRPNLEKFRKSLAEENTVATGRSKVVKVGRRSLERLDQAALCRKPYSDSDNDEDSDALTDADDLIFRLRCVVCGAEKEHESDKCWNEACKEFALAAKQSKEESAPAAVVRSHAAHTVLLDGHNFYGFDRQRKREKMSDDAPRRGLKPSYPPSLDAPKELQPRAEPDRPAEVEHDISSFVFAAPVRWLGEGQRPKSPTARRSKRQNRRRRLAQSASAAVGLDAIGVQSSNKAGDAWTPAESLSWRHREWAARTSEGHEDIADAELLIALKTQPVTTDEFRKVVRRARAEAERAEQATIAQEYEMAPAYQPGMYPPYYGGGAPMMPPAFSQGGYGASDPASNVMNPMGLPTQMSRGGATQFSQQWYGQPPPSMPPHAAEGRAEPMATGMYPADGVPMPGMAPAYSAQGAPPPGPAMSMGWQTSEGEPGSAMPATSSAMSTTAPGPAGAGADAMSMYPQYQYPPGPEYGYPYPPPAPYGSEYGFPGNPYWNQGYMQQQHHQRQGPPYPEAQGEYGAPGTTESGAGPTRTSSSGDAAMPAQYPSYPQGVGYPPQTAPAGSLGPPQPASAGVADVAPPAPASQHGEAPPQAPASGPPDAGTVAARSESAFAPTGEAGEADMTPASTGPGAVAPIDEATHAPQSHTAAGTNEA